MRSMSSMRQSVPRRPVFETLEARTLLSAVAGVAAGRQQMLADLPAEAQAAISTFIAGDQAASSATPVQQAKLTALHRDWGDLLGSTVAISGDTVVVGAPMVTVNGNYAQGAAYVFVKSGSLWSDMTETAMLTAGDGAAFEHFGSSVSISGNTVVVGASDARVNGQDRQGAAYVFAGSGSSWLQAGKLTASDGAASHWFGYSVAISGDTAVVGAEKAMGTTYAGGAAYVFNKPASGWTSGFETARLNASDSHVGFDFGSSVALTGDTVVVGAAGAPAGTRATVGAAYVFTKPDPGWASGTETAKLTASDGWSNDNVGCSVSISGNTVVVGADGTTGNVGAAYVFTKPDPGWASRTETAKLTASAPEAYSYFGQSISIRGDTVTVGTPWGTVGANPTQGAAYVFTKPDPGWASGTETFKLTALDGKLGENFGSSVAVSGDTLIVGAKGVQGGGAAYAFGPPWLAAPVITSIAPNSGPATGNSSVTITGTDFTGVSAVSFGQSPAASFTVDSATQITAISPAGTGIVHVTVTAAGGMSATSPADQFTYVVGDFVSLPPRNTGYGLLLRRNASDPSKLELVDAGNPKQQYWTAPAENVSRLTIQALEGKADTLTVDYANGPLLIKDGVVFDAKGGAPTDKLVIKNSAKGAATDDTVAIAENGVIFNGTLYTLPGVEDISVDTGKGNDSIAVSGLGASVTLIDSAGATDALNFSQAGSALNLSLASSSAQNIFVGNAPTLTLKGTFENVIGSPQADVIKGNSSANTIHGRRALWDR